MWIFWLSASGKEVKATSSVGGGNVFPLSDPNLSPDFLDLYLLLGSLLSFQAARTTVSWLAHLRATENSLKPRIIFWHSTA